MLIYETKIQKIGEMAAAMAEENMIILFGDNAPSDLEPYCVLIEIKALNGSIKQGDTLTIGSNNYEITAVGDIVGQNLESLGHITLNFDGSTTPELPGTLYLEKQVPPTVEAGMDIKINQK